LEQQALKFLGESDPIEWTFKGQVSNEAIIRFYREQRPHLFINVSSTEGLPVSIMEAMAHSVPVIATDVGGTNEIVHDSQNGFLMSPGLTATQLADQIRAFAKLDRARMKAFREAAYQTWANDFNAKINYQHFVEHLLQL